MSLNNNKLTVYPGVGKEYSTSRNRSTLHAEGRKMTSSPLQHL